eukprot:CAMPEP_0181452588 /NCGR_PEP_ID=MMETSP1110-20121109/29285_1 /TAXON_ID=174948 /ORGANISM="Symbiodinium sp., Strain CCMP421" /LENGTH=180 /DNA_ID=CAMNT_0023576877 /DNA_START=301 /DNA_END=845 /DNA_ORIENTATION=-
MKKGAQIEFAARGPWQSPPSNAPRNSKELLALFGSEVVSLEAVLPALLAQVLQGDHVLRELLRGRLLLDKAQEPARGEAPAYGRQDQAEGEAPQNGQQQAQHEEEDDGRAGDVLVGLRELRDEKEDLEPPAGSAASATWGTLTDLGATPETKALPLCSSTAEVQAATRMSRMREAMTGPS